MRGLGGVTGFNWLEMNGPHIWGLFEF